MRPNAGKAYWSVNGDGQICLRIHPSADTSLGDTFEETSSSEYAFAPEAVINLLKNIGRADLQAGLFVRWLDELESLDAVSEGSAKETKASVDTANARR